MHGLTRRQEQTLDLIRNSIAERGYPPTLREIGLEMGIASTNGVNDHLRALERKGHIRREDMKSRALTLVKPVDKAVVTAGDSIEIQVVDRILADAPLLSADHVIDRIGVDPKLIDGSAHVFGLRVSGNGMIERGILAGDYVLVRHQGNAERGNVVVALVGDEAIVRSYYPDRDYMRLQPENAAMAPVLVRMSDWKRTMLVGKVVGLWRRFT